MENENKHQTQNNDPVFLHPGKPRILLVLGGSLFLGVLMLAAFYFGTLYGKAQTIIKESNSWIVEGLQKPSKPMPKPLPVNSDSDYAGWETYEGDYVSFKYPKPLDPRLNMGDAEGVDTGTEINLWDMDIDQQIISVNIWYKSKDAFTEADLVSKYHYKKLDPKTYNGTKWNIYTATAEDLRTYDDYLAYYTKVGDTVYIVYVIETNGWNAANPDLDKFFNSFEFVF